ncbi:MAG: FeoB-associated Cys-rich membrane protein [Firmicutes bacterium]|nr:FeoB-associated Cys-rich membrane protein [Bacillota bacterium]
MSSGIGMDFLIGIIVFVILRRAISYIIKAKKKGVKCVGCPYAGECASKNNGADCNCQSDAE